MPKLYQNQIAYDSQGSYFLYIVLSRVLYGLLKIILLFYENYQRNLNKLSSNKNPLDTHVENDMIKGRKTTNTYHVGNIKISQRGCKKSTKFIKYKNKYY